MTEGVEFDAERVAEMEQIYRTTSMADRRRRVRDVLALEPGESVLSIGTGPGFETRSLAADVGATGHVHGIDTARPMLTVARDRCADRPAATFGAGDAAALPVDDDTFDAAVAVQVYEYVPDLETSLAELRRVLRPGGRAVVFDSDWATLTFNAADQARSARIVEAFDAHCPHPRLALTLKPRLERANFEVVSQEAYVHLETDLGEDAVAGALMTGIAGVVAERGGVDAGEVDAWMDDLRDRAEAGEFFFSLTQYLFLVVPDPE